MCNNVKLPWLNAYFGEVLCMRVQLRPGESLQCVDDWTAGSFLSLGSSQNLIIYLHQVTAHFHQHLGQLEWRSACLCKETNALQYIYCWIQCSTNLMQFCHVVHEFVHHLSHVKNIHRVCETSGLQSVWSHLVCQSHRIGGVDGHLSEK